MPGQLLQADAFVLSRRPPSDAFQSFTLFSAEHGTLLALHRLPRRPTSVTTSRKASAPALALDLFDEVAFQLETSNQGQTWFVKEARLLNRHAAIGRNYESLRAASDLAALIARNPVPEESRASIATLLRSAFAALETANRPDIVFFKSTYRFARDEGYPVKQQWFPTLPAADRSQVSRLLNQPLAAQDAPPAEVARLQRQLDDFLRSHTDILLE